jgi:diacylglycerol kinase family enzyme
LGGPRRQLDLGVVNGEHFAVMSGIGFDARMIHDADADLKDRIGRAAYVVSGRRHLRSERFTAKVRLDGDKWFKGRASCILCGNVGKIFGGITVFDDAVPDDSRLDFGIVTAKSTWEWTRALGRTALGHARHSPFVEVAQAQCAEVRLDQPVQLEIDGGSRPPTDRLRIEVRPRALTVCVPAERMP